MIFLGVVVLVVGVLTRAPFMWVQGAGVVVVGVLLAFIDASRRFDLLRQYADAQVFRIDRITGSTRAGMRTA